MLKLPIQHVIAAAVACTFLTATAGELQFGRVRVTFTLAGRAHVEKPGLVTGNKSVQVLHLEATDVLTYTLGFGA
jgi:hypothetical protein